jgi:hypothetical protein
MAITEDNRCDSTEGEKKPPKTPKEEYRQHTMLQSSISLLSKLISLRAGNMHPMSLRNKFFTRDNVTLLDFLDGIAAQMELFQLGKAGCQHFHLRW